MSSRDQDHTACQATIDRLARELADVRRELEEALLALDGDAREALMQAQARARSGWRVARFIHQANTEESP